jgi:hypothetical protein
MSIKSLIKHFEGRYDLAITISEVTAKVRELVPYQRIEFVEDFDDTPEVLRGMLHQEEVLLGWADEPIIVNQIRFNGNMSKQWQRIVVCKELIHVLDPDNLLTHTPADVAALIDRMRIPLDLQNRFSSQEQGDRIAEFQALAILFPRAARDTLLPHYRNNSISATEIADAAAIPPHYIAFIMDKDWENFLSVVETASDMLNGIEDDQ